MVRKYTKRSKSRTIVWENAPDISVDIRRLIEILGLNFINSDNIYCFRSKYANTRATARIWGLGRIWQIALGEKPSYVIEVISERFDNLSKFEKDKVLLHEINHIPKSFSGALVPHYRKGERNFSKILNKLIDKYKDSDYFNNK